MTGEMRRVSRRDVAKLVKKVSVARSRAVSDFLTRVEALKVDEELFQCWLHELPSAEDLKIMLNGVEGVFELWQTVNGIMVRRKR